MDQPTLLIDDFGPMSLLRPSSVAELAETVGRASANGTAIYPVGGGTMLHRGLPPTRPGVALATTGLAAVLDFPARDMTVTVQAGITLAQLRDAVAAERLRLPVDVPMADRATLGGALAANVSGPRRYGHGTLRDYLLGVSLVNDEGQETKAGGRVVKNVAGYDLGKLYVGSYGTLGVVTQATLKLRPLAEEQAVVVVGCRDGDLGPLLDALHRTRTRPVSLDVLSAGAARALPPLGEALGEKATWAVAVGFEDNRETVSWQTRQFLQELVPGRADGVTVRAGAAAVAAWSALIEFAERPSALLTFRANLRPSATAAFLLQAARSDVLMLQAHAGNGIVIGHGTSEMTVERAAALVGTLLAAATAADGNLTLTRCPTAWKARLPIWGAPRGDVALMRRVKEALDPRRVFNPGRFLDGI